MPCFVAPKLVALVCRIEGRQTSTAQWNRSAGGACASAVMAVFFSFHQNKLKENDPLSSV